MISGYLITLLLIGEHERTGRCRLGRFWAAPGPPAAAGAVHAADRHHDLHRDVPARRPRPAARRRPRRARATCRTGTRSGSARATPRPATSRRCGTSGPWPSRSSSTCSGRVVMIAAAARRAAAPARRQLGAARRRRRDHRRRRRARTTRGPIGTPRGHARRLLDGRRAVASRRPTSCTCRRRRGPRGLLLGAAFAMVWRPAALLRGPMRERAPLLDVRRRRRPRRRSARCAGTCTSSRPRAPTRGCSAAASCATGFATLCVIAAVTHRRSATGALLGNPVFVWIGTRSYGLYLYHWPIFQGIRRVAGNTLTRARVRRRDGRDGRRRRAVVPLHRDARPPAGARAGRGAGCSAPRRTSRRDGRIGRGRRAGHRRSSRSPAPAWRRPQLKPNDIAAGPGRGRGRSSATRSPRRRLRRGDDDDVRRPTTTTTADDRRADDRGADDACAGTVPATAGADAAAATDGRPDHGRPADGRRRRPPSTAGRRPVRSRRRSRATPLGDSVMLGAAGQLAGGRLLRRRHRSPGRSSTASTRSSAAARRRASLGPVVVVALGTNGPIGNGDLGRHDGRARRACPLVVMVTTKADRDYVARQQRPLRALPATFPNVRVVDWAALARRPAPATASTTTASTSSPTAATFYAQQITAVTG